MLLCCTFTLLYNLNYIACHDSFLILVKELKYKKHFNTNIGFLKHKILIPLNKKFYILESVYQTAFFWN